MFLINEFQECTSTKESLVLACLDRTKQHVCFHSQLGSVLTTKPVLASVSMETSG